MKMITTGDIKISVLVDEDSRMPVEAGENRREMTRRSHEEAKKAVRGRKALRVLHAAFGLAQAHVKVPACRPTNRGRVPARGRRRWWCPSRRIAQRRSPASTAWRTSWSATCS